MTEPVAQLDEHLPQTPKTVSVITMQFPAPSETFAARDMRALMTLGVTLDVHSLRPAHARNQALTESFGIETIPKSFTTARTVLKGVGLMMAHPLEALRFTGEVLWRERRDPVAVLKSLLILPRIYQIVDTLIARKIDVVHCFWGHYPSLVLELLERREAPVLRSTFLGSYDLVSVYQTSLVVAQSAHAAFTHARANLASLEALGIAGNCVDVVYRGIEPEAIDKYLDDAPDMRTRDIDILSVCRIIPGKGIERLLQAVAVMAENGTRPKVVIAGDGASLDEMVKLTADLGIAEHVTFTGFVPIDQVYDLMSRARVFSLLSDEPNDRLPNSVKEAMYLGCHCIAGTSVGINELIRTPDHGLIVDSYTPEDIAEKFNELLDLQPDQDRVVRVRAFIEQEFNANVSMQKYLDIWSKASGATPKEPDT